MLGETKNWRFALYCILMLTFSCVAATSRADSLSLSSQVKITTASTLSISTLSDIRIPTIITPDVNETTVVILQPNSNIGRTEPAAQCAGQCQGQNGQMSIAGSSGAQVQIELPSQQFSIGSNSPNALIELSAADLQPCSTNSSISSCLTLQADTVLKLGATLTVTGPATGQFTLSLPVQINYY